MALKFQKGGTRIRRGRRTLAIGVILMGVAAGCESNDATVIRATPGHGGAGSGGAGDAGNGAAAGSGDSAGGTGGSDVGGLAAACQMDAQCAAGLRCYTSTSTEWGGEGPAHGYCSAECTADATICTPFDPAALCYPFQNGKAFCLKGCTYGPDQYETFDPAKCEGREDVACGPVVTFVDGKKVTPACAPSCNSDTDCDGLWCDPLWGLCSATPLEGAQTGAECTFSNEIRECKGACKPAYDPNGDIYTFYCADRCTYGAVPSCGWAGPGDVPADAYCLASLSPIVEAGGPSAGDKGLCMQLCDCNSDCLHPDFVCLPWGPDEPYESLLGRAGHCGPPFWTDGATSAGIACE
jgi:hypothetical protein